MDSLKNKKVLIVGATGGIGAHLVKLIYNSGAQVWIAGRQFAKLNLIAESNQLPASQILEVDLSNSDSVQNFVKKIENESFDIYINAAGIGIIKPLNQLQVSDMQLSYQVNVLSTFEIVKAILPKMIEVKKGLIINIPGILGKIPMSGAAAYCASKYALVGMMQSIREELKRTEIRITQVYLGGVDSPFWDNIDLRVQRDKMIQAEEAAKSIWFLCQQPSSGVVSEMVLQPFNHQAI
ncbi:MAG: SDR family NAD(P)-dependent oxidoreductase [Chitinophagaceae bacterium]|jgi:short-subunit dehydrogenase|nr:SDR family NAD(P)-dependent oxidoreductase [Chitinophagaceae bacterium]